MKRLDALEIPYDLHSFTRQQRRGTNIIARLPGTATRTLMLGAHYDRVAVGEGAVDNAASCAMLLELMPLLKKVPLKNLSLRVAFFDLEEGGLFGSQAYVEQARDGSFPESLRDHKLPDAFINFDIFAYGDSLWVMSPKSDAPLAEAARAAGRQAMFTTRIDATYPPSDHLSFIRANVPSISVSLIDGSEIDGVIQLLKGGVKGDKRPRIFGIIHTANDTLDKVDPQAITRALPVVERLLRSFDAAHTESGTRPRGTSSTSATASIDPTARAR
jgi:Zn-dependent M28 family amino/carboxypeptidase